MKHNSKILIHTALYPEAKPIIQYFNLTQNKTYEQYKIYENDKYLLIVSGIGKQKTSDALTFVLNNFNISKAINIGIAGCKDIKIKLGTLFCCNKKLLDIPFASLTTVDEPLEDSEKLYTTLVDMEADAFENILSKNINQNNIFVFKIVSDYLSKEIPNKSFVYNSIKKSISKWEIVI